MALTTRRRSVLAAAVLATIAATAACVPPPSSPPTITTPPSTTAPPTDVVVQVSPTGTSGPVTVAPGETITVEGSGFTTTGNLGTRPPLAGKPGGVYVVFGRFADTWKPSAGAPSSARQVIEQLWVLPTASFQSLGGLDGLVEMNADGSFTVEVTAAEAAGTNPNYGIAVYPGSGAVNPAEELFVPVTLAAG